VAGSRSMPPGAEWNARATAATAMTCAGMALADVATSFHAVRCSRHETTSNRVPYATRIASGGGRNNAATTSVVVFVENPITRSLPRLKCKVWLKVTTIQANSTAASARCELVQCETLHAAGRTTPQVIQRMAPGRAWRRGWRSGIVGCRSYVGGRPCIGRSARHLDVCQNFVKDCLMALSVCISHPMLWEPSPREKAPRSRGRSAKPRASRRQPGRHVPLSHARIPP